MTNLESIKRDFPLHWLVWNNDYVELQELLKDKEVSVIEIKNI